MLPFRFSCISSSKRVSNPGLQQDSVDSPRDNKNLPSDRGVGHIHRFQRRSQSVQEVHIFTSSGPTSPYSPHIHSGDQRGQTHGTSKGYKNQSRRLSSTVSSALLVNREKSGSHNRSSTSFDLKEGRVRPTEERWLTQDQINTVGSGNPHRTTYSNRKTSPLRATTHETHSGT